MMMGIAELNSKHAQITVMARDTLHATLSHTNTISTVRGIGNVRNDSIATFFLNYS